MSKLYLYDEVLWSKEGLTRSGPIIILRCPNDYCELDAKSPFYFVCPMCGFAKMFEKNILEQKNIVKKIIKSFDFKDSEVFRIEDEMVKVKKVMEKDEDYWIETCISKNRDGKKQLVIYAGSRKNEDDKVQFFLDLENEKLGFDQGNTHPEKVFTRVVADFKNSSSSIVSNENEKNEKF